MVKLEEDAALLPPPPPSPVDGDDDYYDDDDDEDTESEGYGDGARRGDPTLKKGPWTPEEDTRLREYVEANGEGNWNQVRIKAGLNRCGKSCRLRWSNHLRPDLKKGPFDDEEVDKILRMHFHWGNKWAKMATLLPGRTDNEIKNYWNTRLKRHQRAGLPIYPEYLVSQASNKDMNFDTPEESRGTKRTNELSQEFVFHVDLLRQYFNPGTFARYNNMAMGEEVPCPSLVGSNSLSIDAMNPLKRLKSTGCVASDYNDSPSFVQIPYESEKAGCSTSFNYGVTENQLAPPGNAIISSHPMIDGNPSTSWITQRSVEMELPSVQYSNYGLSNAWLCDYPSSSPIEEADTGIESPPESLKSGSISSQNTGLDAIVHKGDAIEDLNKSKGVFEVSLPPFSGNQVLQSSVYTMWDSFPSVPGDDEFEGCPLSEIHSSKSPSSSDAIFAESKFYADSTFTGNHSSWVDIGTLGASLEANSLNDESLLSKDHPMSIYNSLANGGSSEEAKNLSTTGDGVDSLDWNSMPGACNMPDFPNL